MAKYIKTEDGYRTASDIGLVTAEIVQMVQETVDGKMSATNPTGTGSFSMNRKSNTSIGDKSVAMGISTTASGGGSHAEGNGTTASGRASHAEGKYTTASGYGSHAEGNFAQAVGNYSHAEGVNTRAYGYYSHAEGSGGIAQCKSQHVQGEHNILDTVGSETTRGTYAHIVGNGTSDIARSNAHTLDWNGVGWFQGGLQVGGNAQDDGAKNVLLEGDAIQNPSTAAVGQTLVVKSVDENGKPVEWETVDPWVLTDESTGIRYKMSLVDSKLTITEVTSE